MEYLTRTVVAPGLGGAGLGVTVPVPKSERQVLLAVSFRLVTSNAVAARSAQVQIIDATGQILAACAAAATQAASLTTDYSFALGVNAWSAAGTAAQTGPVPTVPLDDGDLIAIAVNLVDVADQISRVRVTLAQHPSRDDNPE